ncbi:MAG: RDD family protein [Gammaproteobacteria bacterium]|nr:RDD family protein [Gammaproteobacteria bacterium]
MENDHNPYQSPKSDLNFFEQVDSESLSQRYASRGTRLGAAILDTIFLIIPLFVFLFAFGFIDYIQNGESSSPLLDLILDTHSNVFVDMLISTFIALILFILVQGYFVYTSSQTLGKKIVGIQVVDLNGKPISGNHYLLARYLPATFLAYLPIIGGLFAILDCLLIFRKDHNCIHDDIAKTRVININ